MIIHQVRFSRRSRQVMPFEKQINKHMKSSMSRATHTGMIISHARFHMATEKKYNHMKSSITQALHKRIFKNSVNSLDYFAKN